MLNAIAILLFGFLCFGGTDCQDSGSEMNSDHGFAEKQMSSQSEMYPKLNQDNDPENTPEMHIELSSGKQPVKVIFRTAFARMKN